MKKKSSTTTINDVARVAGVSTTTVSHVINETRYVSEELVERVNKAISELNYKPSNLARSLRTRSSGTIGIVIPDNTNPFFAEVVRGIEDYCFKEGYSAFLCNSDGMPEKEYHYLNLLREKSVDGLVLVSAGEDEDSQEWLSKNDTPFVVIDREVQVERADKVLVDNYSGGLTATRHLIELGHRSIGCITGPSQLTPSWQRLKGYTDALINEGLDVRDELIIPGNFRSDSGHTALERLMKLEGKPTAIFACNDIMAIGAISAARELQITIPEDLSIIGFDDIALASLMVPQLTTIAQPKRLLGETGAKLLLQKIRNESEGSEEVVLQPELVVRQSTAIIRK